LGGPNVYDNITSYVFLFESNSEPYSQGYWRIDVDELVRKPYRHGNVPNAMRATARAILDEGGQSEDLGLRELARRIGVSPTAVYRHFASREDLLASVAAEGFQELSDNLEVAMEGPNRLLNVGLAYIDFALKKRGLFRLMFGSILADRAKYPRLNKAATDAFRTLQTAISAGGDLRDDAPDSMAAWGLVHGLSSLFIDGLVPEERIQQMTESILTSAVGPNSELLHNAVAN
jgi:AcrR family transcriptional regulator